MNEVSSVNDRNSFKVKETINAANVNPEADSGQMETAKPMITVEIIEYVENAVVVKTILKKTSGNISLMSVDTGEGLAERESPFDTFVQIIDGVVELVVYDKVHSLKTGSSIIIPAKAPYHVNPDGRFKMILTMIKSAYE